MKWSHSHRRSVILKIYKTRWKGKKISWWWWWKSQVNRNVCDGSKWLVKQKEKFFPFHGRSWMKRGRKRMGGDEEIRRWSKTNLFRINKMIVDEPLQVCSRFWFTRCTIDGDNISNFILGSRQIYLRPFRWQHCKEKEKVIGTTNIIRSVIRNVCAIELKKLQHA